MYPTGQMSSACYDPLAGGNYGVGYAMPCCSHGYNYNNYFCPPGPVAPHQHVYPSSQPYVASPTVWPVPYHQVQHPHHYSMPGGMPGNSHLSQDACFPVQHQQQYPFWRPPIVTPQGSCCCACPNHYSHYGSPMSSSLGNDAKVISEPEDVKRVESVKPVVLDKGSNSSQPQQLVWIPPQYLNKLLPQYGDKGPQDKNALAPFDLDRLASLYDKNGTKPVTSGAQKDFPFPIIFMPHNSDNSKGNAAKNLISEIEEKPTNRNNAKPLKLLVDDVERTVPPEPVNKIVEPQDDATSQGIPAQNEKDRVKVIPVKQAGESNDTKPSTNAAVRSRSRSVSPTKTSKLPPVCLRVDPLPRKKNGNGIPKQPGSPSHQKNLQQPSQNGTTSVDVNTKKKEESETKVHHHNTDQAKNVKVIEPSTKESTKDKPGSSINEDGKLKNTREKVGEMELADSVKQSAQPENPVAVKEDHAHGAKARQIISEEIAAVRIQSAYRGYEERKWHSLQKLKQIAKVRDQIPTIKDRVKTLENGADMSSEEFERQRLTIGESIMSHLLMLDTIQGLHPSIRDVRKSVARELIGLQEKLDLLHAQRLKESEQGMDPGRGDVADNHEVKELPFTNGTKEQDITHEINASNQQEKKHEESDKENTKANDGTEDNNENLTKIDNSTYADLHQEEACNDCVLTGHTQDVTQSVASATLEGKSSHDLNDEADFRVKSIAVEEHKESTESGETPLLVGNKCSVADAVSEHETEANCVVVADDLHTVETSQTVVEGEESSMFSCCASVDNVKVLSGELADGKQLSKSGHEFAVEICGENTELVCDNVEKQPELLDLESGSENNAANTGALEEIRNKIKEVDEVATSHFSCEDKPEEAVEISECYADGTNEVIGQEDMSVSQLAGNVNLNGSGILNRKVASAEDEYGKGTNDSESEESSVTDKKSGAGTLEDANTESETCEKDIEKSEAPLEDVNALADHNGAVIDEYETPRLSNVSRTSTEDADSVMLAEDNNKLRETVRKLMESEKDQLAVISTLNERLRSLEKKLHKKKRNNRKLKLHSGAMIKSAHKDNDGRHQNIPICST